MEVKIAKYAGYCFGVKRAIEMSEQNLSEIGKDIFTLGQIIHNPGVVEELDKKGIHSVRSKQDIPSGSTVVIRSHGVPPSTIESLRQKNIHIIDATCPYVKTAQKKAVSLSSEGYFVVLVGTRDHPEVIGIKEQLPPDRIMVAEKIEDLNAVKKKKRIGLLIQTTQTLKKLKSMVDKVLDSAKELKIINTICNTTTQRQNEAVSLAGKVDVMLVVGGKNSANTTHLAHISKEVNKKTYHIQDCTEINHKWFLNVSKVGITGGASTPYTDIVAVKDYLEALR